MVLAYIQICHKLWGQQVCGRNNTHARIDKPPPALPQASQGGLTRSLISNETQHQIPGSASVMQRKWHSFQCSSAQASGAGEPVRVRTVSVCAEVKQVRARRKTARMLIVVLFVFALCYLPISVLNMMKR